MLDLVSAAAEERPVLIVLDDWHWVDAESALVLDFAFRRLDSDAIAVVTTSRRPPADPESGRLEVVRISGLSTGAAMKLLHRTGPYAPKVAESIVRETAGLPLALLEVGAELTPGQRLGEAPLPNPLPVGDRILAEYRSRLSTLPARAEVGGGRSGCRRLRHFRRRPWPCAPRTAERRPRRTGDSRSREHYGRGAKLSPPPPPDCGIERVDGPTAAQG